MQTRSHNPLPHNLIRIAKAHGHKAELADNGGVRVYIPYTLHNGDNVSSGLEEFVVFNLRQLKLVLGY